MSWYKITFSRRQMETMPFMEFERVFNAAYFQNILQPGFAAFCPAQEYESISEQVWYITQEVALCAPFLISRFAAEQCDKPTIALRYPIGEASGYDRDEKGYLL